MASYPNQESCKQTIVKEVLHPLRIQQPVVPSPVRYMTGETQGLLKVIATTAALDRVVVASIAGAADTHPRYIAIKIMDQWAHAGDQLPPAHDIMGDSTISTAEHRLIQYQEQLAGAVNPKRPLLLIEGYDQLSVPVASFLTPVVLAIATHTSHNQLPGAVIMSGQTIYDQLGNHLRSIELNPYVTEDSIP